jgi:hypothetical protein
MVIERPFMATRSVGLMQGLAYLDKKDSARIDYRGHTSCAVYIQLFVHKGKMMRESAYIQGGLS